MNLKREDIVDYLETFTKRNQKNALQAQMARELLKAWDAKGQTAIRCGSCGPYFGGEGRCIHCGLRAD